MEVAFKQMFLWTSVPKSTENNKECCRPSGICHNFPTIFTIFIYIVEEFLQALLEAYRKIYRNALLICTLLIPEMKLLKQDLWNIFKANTGERIL